MMTVLVGFIGLTMAFAAENMKVAVQPSQVLLYDADDDACWNMAFTGPVWRESAIRAKAEERFEKPSQLAMQRARRPLVEVFVWPDSKMACGDEAPEALIVRDAQDAQTVARIQLRVSTEVGANAFGLKKTFGQGEAELTYARAKAIFDGGLRIVYLITTKGRRGGWDVQYEMDTVHSYAAWQKADREREGKEAERRYAERLGTIRHRFDLACVDAALAADMWMSFDIIGRWLSGDAGAPDSEDVLRIGREEYTTCVQRLAAHESDTVRVSAQRLLKRLTAAASPSP